MTPAEVHALAVKHGLTHEQAIIATAIAWAESGLRPDAVGDVDLADSTWGPSVGLWQIRSLRADTGTGRLRDIENLGNPAFNAWAMWAFSSHGTNWKPWSVFKNGRYLNHIDAVRAAVQETPMPTPVDIINAAMAELEEGGYSVTFVGGWEDYGRPGSFEPQGLVIHHTATSRWATGDYPSLNLVRNGRSDLAGPLSQFGLGRSGRIYVIASGKANHAGGGGWEGLSGNGTVWGIEAENDGIGEPWPSEQIDAYIALAAALARHTPFDPGMIACHREWSDGGKIDPTGIDGDWFRARVAERLADVEPEPLPEPEPEPENDMQTPHILLTYGSGVALWHTSGKVVSLASTKQVTDFLERNPVIMDDLTEEQVADIVGAPPAQFFVANSEGVEAVRSAVALSEPAACAEAG